MNMQPSGGTGPSSLWMEGCQSLHWGSGKNSSLRIPSNSADGSARLVIVSFLQARSTIPELNNKNIQLQSSCHILLSPSGPRYSSGNSRNLGSMLRLHWQMSVPATVECCYKTRSTSSPGPLMFGHRSSRLEFQVLPPPPLPRGKHPITTFFKESFELYPDLITKELKHQPSFLWKVRTFVSAISP